MISTTSSFSVIVYIDISRNKPNTKRAEHCSLIRSIPAVDNPLGPSDAYMCH